MKLFAYRAGGRPQQQVAACRWGKRVRAGVSCDADTTPSSRLSSAFRSMLNAGGEALRVVECERIVEAVHSG
jgi:hypothetical protein